MRLVDFITEFTKNNIKIQNDDGSFPGGHNGPYHHPETNVRNTCHWLFTICKCYELTNDPTFKDAAFRSAEFLYSKEARPSGHSFSSLKNTEMHGGIIHQAWAFEALAEASKILEDEKYLFLAEEVFLQHHFDQNLNLWNNNSDIIGGTAGLDKVFNHQLWFAACSSLILKHINKRNSELENRIKNYMDNFEKNLNVLESGLIFHRIKGGFKKVDDKRVLIQQLKAKEAVIIAKGVCKKYFKKNLTESDYYNKMIYESIGNFSFKMIYKSIGYHSYCMYAFALLKEQVPRHPFWDSGLFNKTVDYMLKPGYRNSLEGNLYAYPYNVTGFEVPYALSILSKLDDMKKIEISSSWINEQIRRCYNKKTHMMDRNNEDPLTVTARTYEICRLPMNVLDKIDIEII